MQTIQDFLAPPSTSVDMMRHPPLPAGCGMMNDPSRLDRLADLELHAGHHAAAERLSHWAAELRGRRP